MVMMDSLATVCLREDCQNHGITVNAAVQFAWHKLLQLYTGESKTVVGTTVSGRDMPIEGLKTSIGLYINTLPKGQREFSGHAKTDTRVHR